jgi:hypothetical protein
VRQPLENLHRGAGYGDAVLGSRTVISTSRASPLDKLMAKQELLMRHGVLLELRLIYRCVGRVESVLDRAQA